jgi:basic membrane protein A
MTSFAPKSHLTAAVWNWGPFYKEMVQQVKDGTWKSQAYWYGLEKGIVDLAPFGEMVPEDVRAAVLAKKADIISGAYTVFSGPIMDQSGAVRVQPDAVMTDEELLSFDWFVQGVVGTLQ